MENITEMIKKYWYILAGVAVYFMFFNTKKKRRRTKARMGRMYQRGRAYGGRMMQRMRRR